MDTEFQFGEIQVLEMDGGDSWTTMYLMPLNYTLKNGLNDNFSYVYSNLKVLNIKNILSVISV